MRLAYALTALLLAAVSSRADDPVYLDQLMETPLSTLQTHFEGLKKEGCYRLHDGRFVLVAIDRKEAKPWRVAITSEAPCRRPENALTPIDVRHRKGVELGDSTINVVEKLGRPDASAAPESALRELGEIEYFYICRVSEACARHTSIFIRDGLVTAIAEWYSE